MKIVTFLLLACLTLILGGCRILPHVHSVQERTTLDPEKSYVGGMFFSSGIGLAYLYTTGPDELVSIDLPPWGGVFLVELPPGEYRVQRLLTTNSEGKMIDLWFPKLSERRITAAPGQVTYVGHLEVSKTYLIFSTTYKTVYGFDRMEFEARLGQSYDIPQSVAIVDVSK